MEYRGLPSEQGLRPAARENLQRPRSRGLKGLACLLATVGCGTAQAQTLGGSALPKAGSGAESHTLREVLVPGRPTHEALDRLQADVELGPDEVRAWGASSFSELLRLLEPQLALPIARQGAPIVLIDGAPTAGPSEVDDIPPEAILTIQAYPAEASVRFGYAPHQRVLNLVLRPGFRTVTLEAGGRIATERGWRSAAANGNAFSAASGGRTQLDLKYGRSGSLLESERDLPAWQSPRELRSDGLRSKRDALGTGPGLHQESYRTLLPAMEQFAVSGVLSRTILDRAALTGNFRLDQSASESLLGLDLSALPIDLGNTAGAARRRRLDQTTAQAGMILTTHDRGWLWSFRAGADWQGTRTLTDAPWGPEGWSSAERARSTASAAEVALIGSGALFDLPAGAAVAGFNLGLEGRWFEGPPD
jgi:hypothetical protein